MRLRRFALLLCLLAPVLASGCATETPAEHAAIVYADQQLAAAAPHSNVADYSLPPDKLEKARYLSSIGVTLHFVDEAWGILSLLLLLQFGGIAWMRNTVVKMSNNRWTQGYIFLLLYLLAGTLLSLPLDLYRQHLMLKYGLSVQGWGGWFGDIGKSFGIGWGLGGLLFMLLFWVIRKFPRGWWLIFWGVMVPIVAFGIFIGPYFGPIFNKYEPLQKSNPELVARLEQVVAKGHMDIPPERMYLMKASAKVTTLNADVEGFGSSKRVVVWDNTIAQAKPDEILFIFGHESGHYVLHHIEEIYPFTLATLFVLLFLGFHFTKWAIRRFGNKWGVPDQGDWAAFAVLMLAFSLMSVVLEPVQNGFVRAHEHDADVYGQEAVHGIVADPQTSAKGAFNVLGSGALADPNPNPFYVFWTFSHPSLGFRAGFAKAYDPWAPGVDPKYFKK